VQIINAMRLACVRSLLASHGASAQSNAATPCEP
jgi:hypothetical protein